MLGFINGSKGTDSAITGSSVCTNAISNSIIGLFSLYSYSEIYIPSNFIQLNLAYNSLLEYINTAYAYCNFDIYLGGFSKVLGIQNST